MLTLYNNVKLGGFAFMYGKSIELFLVNGTAMD